MLNVPTISQQDPRWKYKKLGNGTVSISGYGCLLTAFTSILNYFTDKEYTPIDVNDAMKANNGFAGVTKNLWVWGVAPKIYPVEYAQSSGNDYDDKYVKDWIAQGVPVIIKVDGQPLGGLSHYVVAIGDGKIMDTFDGKIKPFSAYKPLGFHVYTSTYKPMPDEQPTGQLTKDQQTDINNWKYIRQKYDISDPKQMDGKIKQYEDKINGLEEDLVKLKGSSDALEAQLRTELKVAKEAKEKCLVELENMEAKPVEQLELESAIKERDSAVKKYELLKNRPLQKYTSGQLLSELLRKLWK